MKKIIVAALFLMLVMPFTAHAHTALTSSNPAQGEVLADSPEELELVFGTIIEEGSTITLKGPVTDMELDNISISENVMKGSINEALVNGQYIISWKIIGEDGHPIEGEIVFSLDAASAEGQAAEEMPQEKPTEEQPAASSSEQQAAADDQAAVDEGTEDGGVLTILLLIAFTVLVGFGSVLLIKMKR